MSNFLESARALVFLDMARTARRGRQIFARMFYGLILSVALLGSYLLFFQLSHSTPNAEQMAAGFFYCFMVLQFLVIFLLTPAYAASAIAFERERRTLESLLVTELGNSEIVLSYYFSRLANLVMVLLTGLPVLGLLQFLGGIDPNLLWAGFAALALTLVSLAGIGVFCSVYAEKPNVAVPAAYVLPVLYFSISGIGWLLINDSDFPFGNYPSTEDWTSPVTVRQVAEWINIGNPFTAIVQILRDFRFGGNLYESLWIALTKYACFHAVIAIGGCVLAAVGLRREELTAENNRGAKNRTRRHLIPRGLGLLRRPIVWNRSLLWKEAITGFGARLKLSGWLAAGLNPALVLLPAIHILAFFGRVRSENADDPLLESINLWVRAVCGLMASFMLLDFAMDCACTISRERDKRTLDMLLATPLGDQEIIITKAWGRILRYRWMWGWLGLVWAIGYITGALHPLALPSFILGWLIYAAFFSALGLWFSIECRTTARSTLLTLIALGALFLICLTVGYGLSPNGLAAPEAYRLIPPVTLFLLPFSPSESGVLANWERDKLGLLLPLVLWALAAGLMWFLVMVRFKKAGGRLSLAAPPGETSLLRPSKPDLIVEPHALFGGGKKTRNISLAKTSPTSDTGKRETAPLVFGRTPWRRRYAPSMMLSLPTIVMLGWYVYWARSGDSSLQSTLAETDRSDPGWRTMMLKELPSTAEHEEDENLSRRLENNRKLASQELEDRIYQGELEDLEPQELFARERVWALTEELECMESVLVSARLNHALFSRVDSWQRHRDYEEIIDILRYDAFLRAQENDGRGALESCLAMITGTQILESKYSYFPWDRVRVREPALAVIERTLAQCEPDEDSLAALQKSLQREDRDPFFLDWLRNERAMLHARLETFQAGQTKLAHDKRDHMLQIVFGPLKGQQAKAIRSLTELVEAAKLPEPDREVKFNQITKHWGDGSFIIWSLAGQPLNVLPNFRLSQAELRCSLVALALERYRRANGRWPESLSELVPGLLEEVPVDPFDGQPLRYRRLTHGVILYSIGSDLIDDGGQIRKHHRSLGSDVGLQLWDVAKRRQPPAQPTKK